MSSRRIVIFAPFVQAFGGVERQIIDLSRFLYGEKVPHTILSLRCAIDFTEYAHWPLEIKTLNAGSNPVARSRSLSGYFGDPQNANIQTPLFFDLKSAFYAGISSIRDFNLHLTDPPSLLPRDVSKYAPSIRNSAAAFEGHKRGPLTALRGEIVHRINRRGVLRASALISTTNAIASELRTLYGKEAIVVNPGVQPPQPRVPTQLQGRPIKRFTSVCRLEGSKRIDWILRAFSGICRTEPDKEWFLDIVGEGSEEIVLRKLSADLGINERVLFHGRVTDERLEELYSASSIFLMPAVQGYGLPALEALIRRVPVVMHRQSGASEILDRPPWVELVSGGPEDLEKAIRRMLVNLDSGALDACEAPAVPTVDQWAKKIVTACGWG